MYKTSWFILGVKEKEKNIISLERNREQFVRNVADEIIDHRINLTARWSLMMHSLRHATPFTAIEAGLLFGRTRDTRLIGSINEHSPFGWRSIIGPTKRFPTYSLCYTWTIAMRRFLLLSLLFTSQHSGSCFERDKRYLVFPTPGTNAPTKVQVLR